MIARKYNLLKYIPEIINVETDVFPERVYEFNKKPVLDGNIVYLMDRELRVNDNFAFNYALNKSGELNKPLKIIHVKKQFLTELKQNFYEEQLSELSKMMSDYDFNITENFTDNFTDNNTSMLITDFNPISDKSFLKNKQYKIIEIDSHNIIPARFISDKREYNAYTFRRKVYENIYDFLTEIVPLSGFKTKAGIRLDYFIENNLDYYSEYKNHTDRDVTSHLSKYLTSGFLSSQRVTLEVIKSKSTGENKEAFLEELIVRQGLAENFCLYCADYKTLDCIPDWAKQSLDAHRDDFRQFLYTLADLEQGKTRDDLWNKIQNRLIATGRMHGYSRIYWAKKILEWSETPEIALDTAIYLNDKYALDAPSPNGYAGILWSIGGLHDRPFANRPIIGKIRPMSGQRIKY